MLPLIELLATSLVGLFTTISIMMNPWNQINESELGSIRGVCVDIDETLSSNGKLTSKAYESLWELKKAGFFVVPITGRPAGWCDHIARFWPVDAVVGENGAFSFYMEEGKRRRIDTPSGQSVAEAKAQLEKLKEKILLAFPGIKFASDQAYRECDLAIDFSEDVKPWAKEEVNRLVELCQKAGAHAKVSSIHVNTWYGDFDKIKGFEYLLTKIKGMPRKENWIYIGDSPNDEPMFEAFERSVGVANIQKFQSQIKHLPKWVTLSESGAGFCEVVDRLIQFGLNK